MTVAGGEWWGDHCDVGRDQQLQFLGEEVVNGVFGAIMTSTRGVMMEVRRLWWCWRGGWEVEGL